MAVTKDGVYIPEKKIALAFSFEGIINNGAFECGTVTYNVLHDMGCYIGGKVEAGEAEKLRETPWMKRFLFLRPLVETAGD